jgi:hypothetical protein
MRPFFVSLGKFIGGVCIVAFMLITFQEIFGLVYCDLWEWKGNDSLYVLILGSVGLNLLLLGEFYDEILKRLNYTGSVIEI